MKRVKITVTREDIRRGVPCDGESCPIALASKRVLPHVSLSVACGVLNHAESPELKLPGRARRFADAFDAGKPVKPFSFTVLVPEELVKKGAGRAGK